MVDGSTPILVDSHCHLNIDLYDQDRELVIERSRQNGVLRIVIPGLDIESSRLAVDIADTFSETYAAIGVHPNDSSDWSLNTIKELRKLATHPKVVAIGEIGLDYFHNHASKDDQQSVFRQQLDLAAELDLPVIIHNRDSSEDIYRFLCEWHSYLNRSGLELAGRPGVLHSFSGDKALADRVVALNFKIGISGPITFTKKSVDLQSLVRTLDTENLLLETDSPFLSPHPLRGKRNEPANVRIVAEKVAEIKGNSLEQIARITTATANRLFKWSDTA